MPVVNRNYVQLGNIVKQMGDRVMSGFSIGGGGLQCLQYMSLLNQQVIKHYPAALKRTSTSFSILIQRASFQV